VCREVFDGVLSDRPNQVEKLRDDVDVTAADLLDVTIAGGEVTHAGLHTNVSVGIRYLDAWLSGDGAAAIDNLMEDAATAEISRSQVWQWIRHSVSTSDGQVVTAERTRALIAEELEQLGEGGRLREAARLFEQVAVAEDFPEFLTLPAYEHLE
jgi:malate synthase